MAAIGAEVRFVAHEFDPEDPTYFHRAAGKDDCAAGDAGPDDLEPIAARKLSDRVEVRRQRAMLGCKFLGRKELALIGRRRHPVAVIGRRRLIGATAKAKRHLQGLVAIGFADRARPRGQLELASAQNAMGIGDFGHRLLGCQHRESMASAVPV